MSAMRCADWSVYKVTLPPAPTLARTRPAIVCPFLVVDVRGRGTGRAGRVDRDVAAVRRGDHGHVEHDGGHALGRHPCAARHGERDSAVGGDGTSGAGVQEPGGRQRGVGRPGREDPATSAMRWVLPSV